MSHDYDSMVDKIEYQYGVRAIQSDAKGLFYLEDDKWKLIGIMTTKNNNKSICILNKKQVEALLNELEEICDIYWGRNY